MQVAESVQAQTYDLHYVQGVLFHPLSKILNLQISTRQVTEGQEDSLHPHTLEVFSKPFLKRRDARFKLAMDKDNYRSLLEKFILSEDIEIAGVRLNVMDPLTQARKAVVHLSNNVKTICLLSKDGERHTHA